jgi:competence protein ComEA
MFMKRFATAAAVLALTATAVLAQTTTTTPTKPATPTTTMAAPVTPALPSTTAAKPAAKPAAKAMPTASTPVNLNTATAAELDTLPSIGKARSKVIMTERAKSPFKDWADFDKRTSGTSVNAGVKTKIKPLTTF